MGILHSQEKKNNLELYLNDVYEKECTFKIRKEEVAFIQTGIETLVQDLVDKILADDSTHQLISDHICKIPHLKEKCSYDKPITEVYFCIQSDSYLQRYVAENESQVKTVKSRIIKVGSFYDGTKNNFPDEFDFIFLLLGVKISTYSMYYFPFLNYKGFKVIIEKHAKQTQFTPLSKNHHVTRKLKFEFIEIHGPAFKLRFIYSNGLGEQRHIHVDLVPAVKIIDSYTQQMFVEQVRKYVEPKTFREEILAAGSSLSVRGNLAFTEIDQQFMKNILSKKHVKVYRILKYLLNGHGEGEKFKELFEDAPHYPSYCIKILIIYHHEACTNTDTDYLGPCVLQVLEAISAYENKEFPKFTIVRIVDLKRRFRLPYLKSTIDTLRLMQHSKDSYCYDKDKIKSVSGKYLDFLTRDSNQDTRTMQCCVLL